MPLLLCPNDNAAMTIVERSGVQFDMCPSCRGVWLDRGEMEKLMEAERAEGARDNPGRPREEPGWPWRDDRGGRWRDDDDDRPRRGGSIFDIFD